MAWNTIDVRAGSDVSRCLVARPKARIARTAYFHIHLLGQQVYEQPDAGVVW